MSMPSDELFLPSEAWNEFVEQAMGQDLDDDFLLMLVKRAFYTGYGTAFRASMEIGCSDDESSIERFITQIADELNEYRERLLAGIE